ncbi:2-deoxy-5-keto-D-gluconate 6-phosphate aldolase domain-containing protein [Amnibacterium endophyticum]|uniref:2-deoxy-5-keto-D-gluconate 6-phosphate aldolase domain-containing protein n=1 Tax=Amnibacterium endophyticum TaxID=2109337 RepID=A0ABW4LGW5_9MICO
MTEQRLFFILAMDQRDSIEEKLYGLDGAPTPEQAADIAANKLLVYRGLQDALPSLPEGVRPGFLVDEQYGASPAVLAAADERVALAMPLEASGQQWFDFEFGTAWREHAGFFGADHPKVLVRDNPGLDVEERAQQAFKVAQIAGWAAEQNLEFIVELLVPATDDDLARVDGDQDRYDREVRPDLTVSAMEFLQDHGVDPAIWKIEGLAERADAERVAATARRGDRTGRCIVLGRHAPQEQLDEWLRVAAPVEGFAGFAIGRSNWWDALEGRRSGDLDEAGARRLVAEHYTHYVRTYLEARGA